MDQAEKCSCCKNYPDDILMLACNHDLCLTCASKNYNKEYKMGRKNQLTCHICQQVTTLDNSSVYELEKIIIASHSSLFNQKNKTDKSQQNSTLKQQRNIIGVQQSKQITPPIKKQDDEFRTDNSLQAREISKFDSFDTKIYQPKIELNIPQRPYQQTMTKVVKVFCPEHPEEELTYYCFDCKINCICSECVIHGIHKNHEVKTTKKAYPVIKEKVEEFQNNLNFKISQIQQRREHFSHQKLELNDSNKFTKKQISQAFQELKQKLDQKEKELLSSCDRIVEQNLKEIDSFTYNLEAKISDLQSTLDFIKDHLTSQDETLLLNFYSANQDRLDDIVVVDEYEKKLLNDTLHNFIMDHQQIQQNIQDISSQISMIAAGAELQQNQLNSSIISNTRRNLDSLNLNNQVDNKSGFQNQGSYQKFTLQSQNLHQLHQLNEN